MKNIPVRWKNFIKLVCLNPSSSRFNSVDSAKKREIIYKYEWEFIELVTNWEKVGQTIKWSPIWTGSSDWFQKADLFQRGHLIYSEPSYWSEFSPRTSGFFPFSSLPSSVEVRYFFHLHQGIGNSTPQFIIKSIYWWFI